MDALALCVVVGTSKPETIARRNKSPFRVEPAPLISPVRIILDPPAADHPIIELPCILYQTSRTLVVCVFLLVKWRGFRGPLRLSGSLCGVS